MRFLILFLFLSSLLFACSSKAEYNSKYVDDIKANMTLLKSFLGKLGSDIEFQYNEDELKKISELLSERLADESILPQSLSESIYLPLCIYIGEVYRKKHGGEWLSIDDKTLNPSGFICGNEYVATDFLAYYMQEVRENVYETPNVELMHIFYNLESDCN